MTKSQSKEVSVPVSKSSTSVASTSRARNSQAGSTLVEWLCIGALVALVLIAAKPTMSQQLDTVVGALFGKLNIFIGK